MTELPASKLGTLEHWESCYEREIATFKSIGDTGENWFGEGSAEEMVEWVQDNYSADSNPAILDVGCGNAHLLLCLYKEGYHNLTGIDYSPSSIALSQAICTKEQISDIKFKTVDILDSKQVAALGNSYDIVTDKGTYDAIALMPNESEDEHPIKRYPQQVAALLKQGGHLLITSCNFTQGEVVDAFTSSCFDYHSHIPRSTFSFGGATGQTIVTVAFTKR